MRARLPRLWNNRRHLLVEILEDRVPAAEGIGPILWMRALAIAADFPGRVAPALPDLAPLDGTREVAILTTPSPGWFPRRLVFRSCRDFSTRGIQPATAGILTCN